MKNHFKSLFFSCFIVVVINTGCVHEPDISSSPKIYFSDVMAVFNAQCASCHGVGQNQHLIDSTKLMSYVVPFNPLKSKLYTVVSNLGGIFMPPPPGIALNLEQRTILYLWILQGADPTSKKGSGGIGTHNDSISFVSDILPVYVSKCSTTGCHDAITQGESYNFSSYADLLARGIVPYNSSASRAYTVLNNTSGENIMPPPPLPAVTSNEKALILKWINEGAKNTNFTVNCDTTKFTFTDINQIIQSSCVGCHIGSSAGGGIQLTSYALVKVIADNGRLVAVITLNTMPKGAPLTDCKKIQIQKWVAAGSPNN